LDKSKAFTGRIPKQGSANLQKSVKGEIFFLKPCFGICKSYFYQPEKGVLHFSALLASPLPLNVTNVTIVTNDKCPKREKKQGYYIL